MLRTSRNVATALILIAVLALAVIVVAQAQAPGGRRSGQGGTRWSGFRGPMCPMAVFMPPPPERLQKILGDLGLTPEQQKPAMDLLPAFHDKLKKIRDEAQPMKDLIAEMKASPTDAARVQSLATQAMKQEGAVLQAELEMWLTLEKMLTPEQQTKLWDLVLAPRPMGPAPGGPPPPGGAPPPPPPAP